MDINIEQVALLQQQAVEDWHSTNPPERSSNGLFTTILEQHTYNLRLWHEEDKARDPQANDQIIAEVKRRIDKLNQARNDWIEKIDEQIVQNLEAGGISPSEDVPLNTETPGCAIDRLSILNLRIFHMKEQAERKDAGEEHTASVNQKLAVLDEQLKDLKSALSALIKDICSGKRRFRIYRQYKMYNDPTMNPCIYGKKHSR